MTQQIEMCWLDRFSDLCGVTVALLNTGVTYKQFISLNCFFSCFHHTLSLMRISSKWVLTVSHRKLFFFMAVLVITHDSHLLISFWNTAANCSAYWAYWTSSVYDTSTPPPCTKSSWLHLLAIYFAPFYLSCLSHLSILVKLLLYVKLSQRCSLAPSCSSNNTAQRQLFF